VELQTDFHEVNMGEENRLTEEVSSLCEFLDASSSDPSGEAAEIYATLNFNSSIELPLSLLNCK